MNFYADLHIHSYYSRATSKDLNLEHLYVWAQMKGVHVVSTGDFVHPGWAKELREKLVPAQEGLYALRPDLARPMLSRVPAACQGEVRFILSTEISNIYKRMDKVRKVHNVVFAPHLSAGEKIQKQLDAIGNIRSDGRPILGLDSRDLLEIVLGADPTSFLVPAHIWTPWFSALGSKSGFDRMEDCFGDLSKHIFAVETGLSSDPPMNWRLSQLDPYVLVSSSDAHSPAKLGRECTVFQSDFSYPGIYKALKDSSHENLVGTVEFFPEEGKYHFDGHRQCHARLHPRETGQYQGLCPVCGKPVTVGVMARVEELADHPEGRRSPNARDFVRLIPLPEIVAEARSLGVNSKAVQAAYLDMLSKLGNEMAILRDIPVADIQKVSGTLIAEGVRRVREGRVRIAAGYDGEYGTVHIFSDDERDTIDQQMTLFR